MLTIELNQYYPTKVIKANEDVFQTNFRYFSLTIVRLFSIFLSDGIVRAPETNLGRYVVKYALTAALSAPNIVRLC